MVDEPRRNITSSTAVTSSDQTSAATDCRSPVNVAAAVRPDMEATGVPPAFNSVTDAGSSGVTATCTLFAPSVTGK